MSDRLSKKPEAPLLARQGDVLVVAFPEMTIPIASYANVKIGGLTYSRHLVDGESVEDQYEKIYAFLTRRALLDGKAKVAEAQAELERVRAR
jgi:hypothetical protein